MFSPSLFSQQIVSENYVTTITKDDLFATAPLPYLNYDANVYIVTYTSVDAKGAPDTLSGLLIKPDTTGINFPYAISFHGSADCKTCVPTNPDYLDAALDGFISASIGMIVMIPDYVGMGTGRGVQTYLHAGTFFSAADDMLKAVKAKNYSNSSKLFLFGFSQGGYGSMATQKLMQEKYGASFVTAAAHIAGIYNLSSFIREGILNNNPLPYDFVTYITVIIGFNEQYHYFDTLSEFFKPDYADIIKLYYDDDADWITVDDSLHNKMVAEFGSSLLRNILLDNIYDSIQNNPDYIVNKNIRENNVCNWIPESPTRLYYCFGDSNVLYENSVMCLDSMYALGADPNIVRGDTMDTPDDILDHHGCSFSAYPAAWLFMLPYLEDDNNESVASIEFENNYKMYPNPAQSKITIESKKKSVSNISIIDLCGRSVLSTDNQNGRTIVLDVSNIEVGAYILRVKDNNGVINYTKLIIQR